MEQVRTLGANNYLKRFIKVPITIQVTQLGASKPSGISVIFFFYKSVIGLVYTR